MSFLRSQALFLGLALALLAPAIHAGPATKFVITVSGTATAGSPVSIIVEAKDSANTNDPTFAGTVNFSSTDPFATVPGPYTFTVGDSGVKTFPSGVTFRTAGAQTLTAFSNGSTWITGTSSPSTTVTGGAAATVAVSAPAAASNSTAFDVTVTAKDVYGNTSVGYPGSVQFASTDPMAVLPSATTLTNGTRTVPVTLRTNGNQTVTATDTVTPSLTGTSGTITVTATPVVGASPASLAFGGHSMKTTTPGQAVTISNTGGSSATITSIAASSSYGVTHDCTTVAPSASCTATVTFTPQVEGSIPGTLTITGNAGTQTVTLSGTGEKSLVTHYYRSILRRTPDSGGKTFWDGEAARMTTLGANVNETWYAMAASFYASTEYTGFNRTDAEFISDLYNTFFNRPADSGGLAYWTDQIAQGMPRGVVLNSFMFSTEFTTFAQGIFGNTSVRAEIDTVTDFYRGLLARLPDNDGFNYWVTQFRNAQCLGAGAVYAQVESISSQFATGAEYAARNRTNAQYVADLYNAFLRRGGDLTGVLYWVGRLNDGSITREAMRREFIASAEFTARVNAIIAAGTFPGVTCNVPGVEYGINGSPIPIPTGPAGAAMCELFGQPASPGGGGGPCGAYQIALQTNDGGNCSSGMSGANAINKAWLFGLEDYTPSSPRNGNSIRVGWPRDQAMVFRFKTGADGSFPEFLTSPGFRYLTIGYSDQPNRGASTAAFVTISEKKCDFDYTKTAAAGTLNGCYKNMGSNDSLLGKVYPSTSSTAADYPYCGLKANTVYYLNIRFEDVSTVNSRGTISCPIGQGPLGSSNCGFAMTFN